MGRSRRRAGAWACARDAPSFLSVVARHTIQWLDIRHAHHDRHTLGALCAPPSGSESEPTLGLTHTYLPNSGRLTCYRPQQMLIFGRSAGAGRGLGQVPVHGPGCFGARFRREDRNQFTVACVPKYYGESLGNTSHSELINPVAM